MNLVSGILIRVICLGLLVLTFGAFAGRSARQDVDIETRVDQMLAKLSLRQKLDLLGGVDGMFIRDEPAIGLPRLKMSDGPVGVRTWGPTTAFPAGIALAAAWDPDLAETVGSALGEDARARGVNFLLGPGVNIYRAPMNGRNFEYFGEDPYLASRIVVGYVKGVQSHEVVATVKHFALNNQEFDRHNVSSDADERTMREIYFPCFEAAVTEAHAGAVMNSYNLINGVHATENSWLNNQVLKTDWKFDGILMSDWGSTYDGIAAANAGLDLEMPAGEHMNAATLEPALETGKVAQASIDDKVRRILRIALKFHFLDRPQQDLRVSTYNQAARAVALEEARESVVLLKNDRNVLPLDRHRVHTIAVLGSEVWPAVTGGGGSSTTTPYQSVSLLEGLTALGAPTVLYRPGIPSLRELIDNTEFEGKVSVKEFADDHFVRTSRSSAQLKLNDWKEADWVPPGNARSFRYETKFVPRKSGKYLILALAAGEDSYAVYVNSKPMIEQPRREGQAPRSTNVTLAAGEPVAIRVDYILRASAPRFGLGIRAIDDLVSPDAVQVAAMADVAIVSVGFNAFSESEGFDRTYALPAVQEELIHSVSKVNRNTVVLLTAGGDVETESWLKNVPVFLHNWYPGQEGGTALAEILLGNRGPEGKLPISFNKSWEDDPVHDHYYPLATGAGETPHVKYAEGVFLGYRYYTSSAAKPLFPFGFGLSYTEFAFENLQVSIGSDSEGRVRLSFDITNTGKRAGAEVAQVYVGDPSAQAKRPVKELKGFQKVRLSPGERQTVRLTLDRRALSYWDESQHRWRMDPGKFIVYVGDSSENTPLAQEFVIQ